MPTNNRAVQHRFFTVPPERQGPTIFIFLHTEHEALSFPACKRRVVLHWQNQATPGGPTNVTSRKARQQRPTAAEQQYGKHAPPSYTTTHLCHSYLLLDGSPLEESAHHSLLPDPESPERPGRSEFRRPENHHLPLRHAVESSRKFESKHAGTEEASCDVPCGEVNKHQRKRVTG